MLDELNQIDFSKPEQTDEEKELAAKQPRRYSFYEQIDVSEKGINFFIASIFLLLIMIILYGIVA